MTDERESIAFPPRARRRARTALVGCFAALVYFTVSREVTNCYPFSTYGMYEGNAGGSAARILVLDEHGDAHQLERFEAFDCGGPVPLQPRLRRCEKAESTSSINYVERDLQLYLDARLGEAPEGERVRIVWRAWTIDDREGPPPFTDCELARCLARRTSR